MANETVDVCIIGGGLAGMCLALQLRRQQPDRSIVVLEKQSFPVPEAAWKVGESTVEIGAHYFAEVLGLREHLQSQHLRKLGLRMFFPSGENRAIETRPELGSNHYFVTGTFQIDRGRLENHLFEQCLEAGVQFRQGARVRCLKLSSEVDGEEPATQSGSCLVNHSVAYSLDGSPSELPSELECRWVVDASGVASVMKRTLEIERPSEHEPSSAWFRIGTEIDLNSWSTDIEWGAANRGQFSRWLSTNHLIGEGYWVWLIPLSSGSTSIGIVADPEFHPLSEFNTFEKALSWLDRFEPQCGAQIRAHADKLQDFSARKHYSCGCSQLFSANRWAITGDAGVFIDPLYSPGSDFIAISNTFISELIRRDFINDRFEQHARILNDLYFSLLDNTFHVFRGQYRLLGNSAVMSAKVVWDFAVYWAFLAFAYFNGKLHDLSMFVRVRRDLQRVAELNAEMQSFFLKWHSEQNLAGSSQSSSPSFVDIQKIGKLYELNAQLSEKFSDDEFASRLGDNIDYLHQLSEEIKSGLVEAEAVVRTDLGRDGAKQGTSLWAVARNPSTSAEL